MDAYESVRDVDPPAFHDRSEAGRRLADALVAFRGQSVLVLGIPRGGVPVAAALAQRLSADLDVVVARKLGAPYQLELAIGAMTANGGLVLDYETIDALDIGETYLDSVIQRESDIARKLEARIRGTRPAPLVSRRVVVVVDDGLATGATMCAAVGSVRKHRPRKVVAAVPVGSRKACVDMRSEADEVVCLVMPEPLRAVGLHYDDFGPVEDGEVQRILQEFAPAIGNIEAVAAS